MIRAVDLPLDLQQFILRPIESPLRAWGPSVAKEVMRAHDDNSVKSVPLQLALVVLRLTRFAPNVFLRYLPVLKKKLVLLTTARHFHSMLTELQQVLVWSSIHPVIIDFFDTIPSLHNPTSTNATLFASSNDRYMPSMQTSLSQSPVWAIQQAYYKSQGMAAWSSNTVPYGVSSSSFVAAAYARVVFRFFADCYHRNFLAPTGAVNCFVLEGGSGSCKFAAAFVPELMALLRDANLLQSIRPCTVLTDLCADVIESRMIHPVFQSLRQQFPYAVDFAVMSCDSIIRNDPVHLRLANTTLTVAGQPLFLIGNYFLDSLPTDAFVVDEAGTTFEIRTDSRADEFVPSPLADVATYYKDDDDVSATLNQTLASIVEVIRTSYPGRRGLVLFPVHAFQFLSALRRLQGPATPFAMLVGDATVHFSDLLQDIPELSPHADCFCLPVDFDVIQRFLDVAFHPTHVVQVTSTVPVFSDSFQVLHATMFPTAPNASLIEPLSHECFTQELKGFGANDCDLILGALEGSRGFSTLTPQAAFLALSNFDFDVFLLFKWQIVKAAAHLAVADPQRDHLVSLGTKCYQKRYSLAVVDDFNVQLSMARWFYAFRAYEASAEILKALMPTHDVRALYLLGLVCAQLGARDKARLLLQSCHSRKPHTKFAARLKAL
ncbi:hypothetical protein, variant 1 [Aphanomyces invadans]|uniref:Uncharacterized protein n=1 Tax=Aphanomyces invadans TaxID=157072 RepID=A0A024UQ44_9STRA|nr:hypothetical protein, variant 1 [Aphanomyces invadans]ETW07773.1 hypothetical protein, variant 1 [Aphanomyces invadans]|eukprot:XP_008863866.1 hypothetical protein, variant 1 [Aphanomyces invadans]